MVRAGGGGVGGNFFEPQARGRRRNDIQLFGKMIRGSFSSGRRRLSSATLLQRSYTTRPRHQSRHQSSFSSLASCPSVFLLERLHEFELLIICHAILDRGPSILHLAARTVIPTELLPDSVVARSFFSFSFFSLFARLLHDGTMKRINDRFTDQLGLLFVSSLISFPRTISYQLK